MSFSSGHESETPLPPPEENHEDDPMTPDAEAPAATAVDATDGSPSGPSHHPPAATNGHDHDDDAWLAHELAPCFEGDWFSSGSDALQCVPHSSESPEMTQLLEPQSTQQHAGYRLAAYAYGTESSDDNASVKHETKRETKTESKLEALATVAARDLRLHDNRKDDIKVERAHQHWVSGSVRLELNRQRQRGYEQKYRKKRRSQHKRNLDEWASKEIELHLLLQQHVRPWVADGPYVSYTQLLEEERAARIDAMQLRTLERWHEIVECRNKNDEILCTRAAWATIDRGLLGPCVIKPYRPFRLQFEW